MTLEAVDRVVNPKNKGFEDLNMKPVAFGHRAHELVNEMTWMYGARDVTKRDSQNA